MATLAELEQVTAERVGPFAELAVLTGDEQSATVEALRSTIDLGGWVDLHVLRREATQPADRVARVKAYDPALAQLQVDRRYTVPPQEREAVELHHLHPDLLRRGVRAALRRTWCQFWLTLEEADPDDPDAPVVPATGPVDLTEVSGGWLRLPQQVLDVLEPATSAQSLPGWRAYQHNGRCYLLLPNGASPYGCSVVGSRAHFTLVNGGYTPDGPLHDDDELDCDVLYAAAMAHAELWRIGRASLEAVAAEARQATQTEAAAEATRMAVAHAPWLFAPTGARTDRIAPLTGLTGAGGPNTAPSLQNAWVNGPTGTEPTHRALVAPSSTPAGRNG